jgi:hypothetical protein
MASSAPLMWTSLAALAVCTIGGLIWFSAARSSFEARANETGPFEWLTAVFFLLAAFGFVVAALRGTAGSLWLWGLAAGCFLVGGEELSWGQRIFHYGTPEVLNENNVQGEANLHNIDGVTQSIRAVGVLGLIGVFLLLPLAVRMWPRVRSACDRYRFPIYPVWPAAWWLVAVAFWAVPRAFGGTEWALDEYGELLVAVAFAQYALLSVLPVLHHASAEPTAAAEPGVGQVEVPTARLSGGPSVN